MTKVTKKFLRASIADEKAANHAYLKRATGKDAKIFQEIARDERDHRKKLTKLLKRTK